MFPVSATCSAKIKSLTTPQKTTALYYLKDYVESYKVKNVEILQDELSFTGDFIQLQHRKFVGINKAVFHLSDNKITFTFYMYGMLLAIALLVVYAVTSHKYQEAIILGVIIICINWGLTRFKFSMMLKQLAEGINAIQ